jgi:predicted membrane protein
LINNFSQEAILKMDFLFSGLFWGIILILLGVSIIVRIVFHIHVPIVRVVFALILIYLGIRVLVGGSWLCSHHNGTIFGSSTMSLASGRNEYKVIFGATSIDATAEVTGSAPERVTIKTIFGESRLIIASSVPTVVHVNTAFGEARFPDGNSISFGETTYKNDAAREGKAPMREIDAKVVFGGFFVVESK